MLILLCRLRDRKLEDDDTDGLYSQSYCFCCFYHYPQRNTEVFAGSLEVSRTSSSTQLNGSKKQNDLVGRGAANRKIKVDAG